MISVGIMAGKASGDLPITEFNVTNESFWVATSTSEWSPNWTKTNPTGDSLEIDPNNSGWLNSLEVNATHLVFAANSGSATTGTFPKTVSILSTTSKSLIGTFTFTAENQFFPVVIFLDSYPGFEFPIDVFGPNPQIEINGPDLAEMPNFALLSITLVSDPNT